MFNDFLTGSYLNSPISSLLTSYYHLLAVVSGMPLQELGHFSLFHWNSCFLELFLIHCFGHCIFILWTYLKTYCLYFSTSSQCGLTCISQFAHPGFERQICVTVSLNLSFYWINHRSAIDKPPFVLRFLNRYSEATYKNYCLRIKESL